MENFVNETSQQFIPLSMLRPSPLNTFEIGDIEDLKSSIRSLGILTPLSVIGPCPDNTYVILSGERRYRAANDLKAESGEEIPIPCHIVGPENMDETTQQLIIESSNVDTRDDFNRLEHQFRIVELLKKIYDEQPDMRHKDFVKEVQKHMKTSKRYSRMYVQIFEKAEPSVRDLVKDGKLAVSQAARLSSLPKEMQDKAAEDLKNGSSQKTVVEQYVKKKDIPKEGEKSSFKEYEADEDPCPESGQPDFSFLENEISDEEIRGLDSEKTEYQDSERPQEKPKFTKSEYEDAFSDSGFGDVDLSDLDSMMNAIGHYSSTYGVDDVNVNLDTSGQFKSIMAANNESDERVEKTRRSNVISWCERILKDGPNDDDWEVIEYCKKIADRF